MASEALWASIHSTAEASPPSGLLGSLGLAFLGLGGLGSVGSPRVGIGPGIVGLGWAHSGDFVGGPPNGVPAAIQKAGMGQNESSRVIKLTVAHATVTDMGLTAETLQVHSSTGTPNTP